MTRVDVPRELAANGRDHPPDRLAALATELDPHPADLFVIAARPVPVHLLPPNRDLRVLRHFAERVTYCRHDQLAALAEHVRAMPAIAHGASSPEPETGARFPMILSGLMRNRGMGVRELPFTGLSMSTIHGMRQGSWLS